MTVRSEHLLLSKMNRSTKTLVNNCFLSKTYELLTPICLRQNISSKLPDAPSWVICHRSLPSYLSPARYSSQLASKASRRRYEQRRRLASRLSPPLPTFQNTSPSLRTDGLRTDFGERWNGQVQGDRVARDQRRRGISIINDHDSERYTHQGTPNRRRGRIRTISDYDPKEQLHSVKSGRRREDISIVNDFD